MPGAELDSDDESLPWELRDDETPPDGEGASEAESEPAATFWLVVEQTIGVGNGRHWTVDPPPWPAGDTREQARAAALDCAREFIPQHPVMHGSRQILRLSPDAYLVVVDGAASVHSFRVSVAEEVAPLDGEDIGIRL